MRTFRYVHKDAQGVRRKGTLTATDIPEARKILEARGIRPLSLDECDAPSILQGQPLLSRSMLRQGAFCLLILFIGIGVGRWVNRRAPTAGVADHSNGRQAVISPQAAAPAPLHEHQTPRPAVSQAMPVVSAGTKSEHARMDAVAADGPTSGHEAMRKPGGSVGAGEEDQQEKPPAPPRLYHSGTEQVIGWLANTTPGGMPPLLPRLNPREDISVILTNDIAIREDDNAATVAAKENLAYAKQALKEYLAEGGTPDMFLNAYHDHLRVAFDEWRNAQRYASELVKAGEQEAAVRFVEEQNRVFAAKGIRPIRLIGPRQPPSK